MRTRRRIAALVVSAAALGVGFVALPSSAAAAPPVVPTCAFPNTPGSDSCASLKVDGVAPPVGSAYENIKLGVRVRSQFTPSTSETNSVNLRFDDDIALNLAGIPSCPAAEVLGKNISQAYEQCGPGADGNPPSEGNAFLSAAGNVSGIGSTIPNPGGAVACTMIFKGATNNALTIYARAPVANATTGCNSPATHTGGTTTVVFTGNLTHQPAASAYEHDARRCPAPRPRIPPWTTSPRPVTRGAAFRARCPAGVSPHKMQGTWDYTAAGDANDLHIDGSVPVAGLVS